jgi:hypothetical protein
LEDWFRRKTEFERVPVSQSVMIAIAVECLEGNAMAWWTLMSPADGVEPDAEQVRMRTDWRYWSDALCSYFPDIRTQEQRMMEFGRIRQTKSVQAYIRDLEAARTFLVPRPSDQLMTHYFQMGLKPYIRTKIADIALNSAPKNYLEWKQEALHREIQELQNKDRLRWEQPKGHITRSAITNIASGHRKDKDGDTEMSLNAISAGRPASNFQRRGGGRGRGGRGGRQTGNRGNSQTANDARPAGQEDRKCYRCERTGHLAKECKAKKTASGDPIVDKPRGSSGRGDHRGKAMRQ